MSDDSLLSSLPDAPVSRSVVEAIEEADGVRWAISPTWKEGITGDEAPEKEHTDDVIVITGERIKYLSREPGTGWTIARDEHYTDDEEFEDVMDEVHDYAVEHSRKKLG